MDSSQVKSVYLQAFAAYFGNSVRYSFGFYDILILLKVSYNEGSIPIPGFKQTNIIYVSWKPASRMHGRIQRGEDRGSGPPWNCQIISFCHVEIFRQTPSGNLDPPPPPPEKIFWIRAWNAGANKFYDTYLQLECTFIIRKRRMN